MKQDNYVSRVSDENTCQQDADGGVDGKIGNGERIAGNVLALAEIRVQHLARSLHGSYVFLVQGVRPQKYRRVL